VFEFLTMHGSYLGIILFLVLTGCGLPIPEEVPIVLAGVLSAKAESQLVPEWAFAACLVGALLGDCVMYAIGYHFGHNLLREHPKFAKFLRAEREQRFEQAIERHGFKVMLLSRFMVGVRGPVYLAAGVVRMPFRAFLLFDFICATLVVGTFFSISYVYGERIAEMVRDIELTFTLVVLLALGLAGLWMYRRHRLKVLDLSHPVQQEDNHDVPGKNPREG
jgi:membrane protein DedA with SNARE-associated domain